MVIDLHAVRNEECSAIRNLMNARNAVDACVAIFRIICLDRQVVRDYGGEPMDVWGMLERDRGCLSGPIRRRCIELGVV